MQQNLLNYFKSKIKIKLNKKKIIKFAAQIGSDVPINLEKKKYIINWKKKRNVKTKTKF